MFLGSQDVLSVVDTYGDQVYFINKRNGRELTRPYSRQLEEIWGICMYDDETQPPLTGISRARGYKTFFMLNAADHEI